MGITQKEIARNLGVSLITVSRAINNTGYVSPQIRKRISDYIKEKSYIPNRASQALARKAVRIIGVFSSTSPGYFWGDVRRGTALAAVQIRHFNYDVHFHAVPDFDTPAFKRLLKKEIKEGLSAAAFVNTWLYNMKEIFAIADKAGLPWLLFNIDDPASNRLCYIGADYPAAGRLAANFIGKALRLKESGTVLVIGIREARKQSTVYPDVNDLRFRGFMDKIKDYCPPVKCQVEYLSPPERNHYSQIRNILTGYQGKADAVYFIPAQNALFLRGLEKLDYRNTITILNDADSSALRGLHSGLLTAVVYQDPLLQGYMAVKTLESILESKDYSRRKDVSITHTLIFQENIDFLKSSCLLET